MRIAHISDVHIRLLTRHLEYKKVFVRLFASLRKEQPDAIVLAGDIVHSKTELTPEMMILLFNFLESCGKIAPTFVMLGNHDCNVKNPNKVDALSPVFKIRKDFKNVTLVTDAETLPVGDNVALHFFSILYPEKTLTPIKGKVNIAVAHGMVKGSVSENGYTFPDGDYDLEDFYGFDITMLGDIHRMQELGSPHIAYSGSLIQQNFGESLEKGYLMWDTKTKTSRFVHVPNEHLYYTLEVKGFDLPDIDVTAKHLHLRVLWQMPTRDPNDSSFIEFNEKLKAKYAPDELTVISIPPESDGDNKYVVNKIQDVNKYVVDSLIEFGSEAKLNEEQMSDLMEMDKELSDKGSFTDRSHMIWNPTELKFSNLFSYGKNTSLKLDERGITGIFAPNATGKTALVNAFVYSIFGRIPQTHNLREAIKKGTKSSKSEIHMEIDGKQYRIVRNTKLIKTRLKIKSGPFVTRATSTASFEVLEDGRWVSLNDLDKKSTDRIIEKYVGSVDDFLLTSFSAQNDITAFIETDAPARKDVLIRFLGLDFLEEKHRAVKDQIKDIETEIKVEKRTVMDLDLTNIKDNHAKALEKKDELTKTVDGLVESSSALNSEVKQLLSGKKSLNVEGEIVPLDDIKTELSALLADQQSETDYLVTFIDQKSRLDQGDESVTLESLQDAKRKCITSNLKIKGHLETIAILERQQEKPTEIVEQCNTCPLMKAVVEAEKQIDNLQGEIVEQNEGQIEALRSVKVESKEALEETLKARDGASNWQQQIYNASSQLASINAEVTRLENLLALHEQNEDIIQHNWKITCEVNTKEDEELEQRTQLEKARVELTNLEVRLSHYQHDMDAYAKAFHRLQDLEKQLKVANVYLKATHRDGIPYQVILNYLPVINFEVNNVLSDIVDFTIYIMPDQTDRKALQIYISYKDGEERQIDVASGMERMLSSLALRAALIKISKLPKPSIWIIDEGFGSLDKDNLQSMRHLFHKLKTMFSNIMIISHVTQLRDIVDNEIRIEKNGQTSKIVT
jgi:DNA repair exonuclease SbcCD ATPase subunit/DNA repair exonuclease SbcCD nuclease subunit